MLEAGLHANNVFLTLTYNDDHLPGDGSLRTKDLQNWLKRVRKSLINSRLRFYACGEYGSQTSRAHYHAVLFNAPSCVRGRTNKFSRSPCGGLCCPVCTLYQKSWSLDNEEIGTIDAGLVEPRTAAYIGGYIIKGKTNRADARLGGREPEFSTKSLNPGLGAYAIDALANAFVSEKRKAIDIPTYIEFGGEKYPLGRYLTQRFRIKAGIDDATAKAIRTTYAKEKMLHLRSVAQENSITLQEAYAKINAQKILNWKAKRKIKKRKDTL